jgi:hypothetical protein
VADTALAPVPAAATLIVTPEQYTTKLQAWQRNYHVLAPFSQISGMAPNHGLMYTAVTINSDAKSLDGDVYDNAGGKLPWLKDNERALAKRGLRKIAEALGVSYTTQRTDPRTIPNYWEVRAVATYRGLDGAVMQREVTQDWDLRDGSPRLKGMSANQISEARKNGLRNCETRAINAVIRECGTGLPQKFTAEDLRKPFIGVRVVYQPDMSDPDTRRIVTERALAGTAALYPARQLPAAEPLDDLDDVNDAQPDEAPGAPTVGPLQSVTVEQKTRKSDGGTFPKWTAVDVHGVAFVTLKPAIGKALEQLYAAKTPVELVGEENNYGDLEVLEVLPQPTGGATLPGMGAL